MDLEEQFDCPPDPERMIEGLRDTGYEFDTAIADIVDNSIAANATKVDLTLALDWRGNIRLSIADDGDGMDLEGLKNAMRYGARKRPNPASLGKYGLGLKTASTAFCRALTLVSRPSGDAPTLMATWDLDHVAKQQSWALLLSSDVDEEAQEHLDSVAPEHSGTVVVWGKVDRLLPDFANKAGKPAQKALERKVASLRQHLSMVYQRFLDPKDGRARTVGISVNGIVLRAWDPFVLGLSELVGTEDVPTENEKGEEATFSLRAYTLPRREEFPTPEQAKEAALSSDRQGIYVYRENRLIHESDWLGLYQKEPHYTLLRVEFSFDHRLDDAFQLDIKKSQIILDEALATYLQDQFLPAPRREADRRYREGQRRETQKKAQGAHDTSNANIKDHEADAGGAKVSVTNPAADEAEVENAHGRFKLKIPVRSADKPGEVFVKPVDSIPNGLLYEPAIIERKRAVLVNTSHPYYRKVYVPNFNRSVTMQGMDSLLWALSVGELSTMRGDKTQDLFKDLRYEVSRILEKLVEGLPEPELEQDAA
ncbi:ATP-binding protein [Sphingopyxis sp. MC1]|uniref:ATP-binding protein n=1 Tax=Sphingopyxis sp. MC1 TaxID=1174684 RepID=UPI0002D18E97|nr:ATP-binding protein [Sphingopyxis sp. MC1]ENY82806.1 hypothetical protein EBMC1_01840 [Sphingopyxis sp. MC1]MBN2973542.1 ATP-binding protein [Roseomonas aeriglobus]